MSQQFFVWVNGTRYPVPLDVNMTVQSVLDYMNEHYSSVLVPNCSGMKLLKEGKVMKPAEILENYQVLNGDTLHLTFVMSKIFVRVNGTPYPVPLDVNMTVQSVLDYMNEHYSSVLVPNCSVMKLYKEGKGFMNPAEILENYQVLNEDTLYLRCVMHVKNGGKRTKRTKRTIKPRNIKSKSKKNGHKRK
jgi:hypothetical protein